MPHTLAVCRETLYVSHHSFVQPSSKATVNLALEPNHYVDTPTCHKGRDFRWLLMPNRSISVPSWTVKRDSEERDRSACWRREGLTLLEPGSPRAYWVKAAVIYRLLFTTKKSAENDGQQQWLSGHSRMEKQNEYSNTQHFGCGRRI